LEEIREEPEAVKEVEGLRELGVGNPDPLSVRKNIEVPLLERERFELELVREIELDEEEWSEEEEEEEEAQEAKDVFE
jgi:hypothetical protein